MFDYMVVGAGFAGSVMAERLAKVYGKKVLIVEKRPHIFHTNSQDVFDYLSQFTEWRPYQHRVLASVDGQLMPIPINLTCAECGGSIDESHGDGRCGLHRQRGDGGVAAGG